MVPAASFPPEQQILQRENARRSDSVSTIERKSVYDKILELSIQLGEIKGKISTANIGIYSKLERMAELKSHIAFLNSLPKRVGDEITSVGYNQEKLTYKWDSFIDQEISIFWVPNNFISCNICRRNSGCPIISIKTTGIYWC